MDAVPSHYSLTFRPDLKNASFGGSEEIRVHCASPTNTIRMDCAEIRILSCKVESGGRTVAASARTDEKKEELTIRLGGRMSGDIVIRIEFEGVLNDRLLGFYRSQYMQDGKVAYMATTQFETADARRAFPCWDTPDAKATFDISILAQDGYAAISNMPVSSRKRTGGKTLYSFETTPVMSTYLVYLGVGQFEYLTGKAGGVSMRVVTTKGNKSKGKYALNMAGKILAAYEDYFGIRYPLPKLDLIAVPDFAAGAMENWGAITFRETILLYDPKTSSTRTKQFIAEVISHEIAHQWFGNLVTMRWWNDLWLNESFATFMATKFVDRFHPEWDLWDQYAEDTMNVAMGLDALRTTHPIDVKVRTPAQVREIFDAISYDKGGCILQMIEHHVGEPAFQKGLKRYLSKFKYSNASGSDLWESISKASGKPVGRMVDTWLRQPGFPVIHASQEGRTLRVRQERYLLDRTGRAGKGLWHVPLSVGSGRRNIRTILTEDESTIDIPDRMKGFVVNQGRRGFYRVRYDGGMLARLKETVREKRVPAIDRWAVQNDLHSMCVSGHEEVSTYLDFACAYADEESYLASFDVAHNLTSMHHRAFGEEFSEEIRIHAAEYLAGILARLGWSPKKTDSHTDALLRAFVIQALGRMDDMVLAEAQKRYRDFLESGSLHPDIAEAVCSLAAWGGTARTHAELVRLYKGAGTMEEKLRFLGAMCGFSSPKLLLKTLEFAKTRHVRSQNMQLPIVKIAANPHGREILWPWLRENWGLLYEKVGHGNPLINRIVASISQVADESMTGQIREFFKDNPSPGTERTQSQVIERIRINSRMLKRMRREFGAT